MSVTFGSLAPSASHPAKLFGAQRLLSFGVKVTVLVGGVGGARFLLGVQHLLGLGQFGGGDESPHELTAVVNIGDDAWMFGVRICPDLDTCMYTLGGGIDPERGWGHRDETWHAKEELAAYGVQPDWFGLGDRDLATHLVRTQMLTSSALASVAVTERAATETKVNAFMRMNLSCWWPPVFSVQGSRWG